MKMQWLSNCVHWDLKVEQQLPIKVRYRGEVVGEYFADLVVEDKIIIELKAVSNFLPSHEAQLLNYLKATPYEIGLLLNFGLTNQKRKFSTTTKNLIYNAIRGYTDYLKNPCSSALICVHSEKKMSKLFGGIEAGGTKFVCAVGTGPDDIRAETRFPTTTPEETIGRSIAFFQEQTRTRRIGGHRHCRFWTIRSQSTVADVWLHHHHAQAGLGQHRFCRSDENGAGRASWF